MAELQIPENLWTDDLAITWTRQGFLDKLHCEGGIEGMVLWGGADCFPPSLREMAVALEKALVGA